LQRLTDSSYLVHDRLFTGSREFTRGESATISYHYDRGKLVQPEKSIARQPTIPNRDIDR
jgi:hypothetical protein